MTTRTLGSGLCPQDQGGYLRTLWPPVAVLPCSDRSVASAHAADAPRDFPVTCVRRAIGWLASPSGN